MIATDFVPAPPKDGPNPFRLCPDRCDEQLNARLPVQPLLSSCLAIILSRVERLSIENRYQKFLVCSMPLSGRAAPHGGNVRVSGGPLQSEGKQAGNRRT